MNETDKTKAQRVNELAALRQRIAGLEAQESERTSELAKVNEQLCFEIADREQVEKKIKRRSEFERTIFTISSRFVRVSDINDAINSSVYEMGRFSGASRVYVFLFNADLTTMDNTHEWCADGVSPPIDNLKNLPADMFPWWMQRLRKDEAIHITDVSGLPATAEAERELLESQHIKSLLVLPLNVRRELAGFIGFDNVVQAGNWGDEDLALLKLFSEILGNALERNRAEEALRESEKRYRSLVETSPDAITLTDLEGKILICNQQAAELQGFECVEDMLGRNAFDFVAPEHRQLAIDNAQKTLEMGSVKNLQYISVKANGTRFPVDLSASLIVDTEGNPRAFIGVARDTTERAQAEKALRESEEKHRDLVENITDLIYAVDGEGVLTYVSPAVKPLLGVVHQRSLVAISESSSTQKTCHVSWRVFRPFFRANLLKTSTGF